MTSATASALATTEPADVHFAKCAPQLPLHNVPSMHDILAQKRQRRSLDEVSVEPQQDAELPSEQQASLDSSTVPVCRAPDADAMQTNCPQLYTILSPSSFTLPVLPAVPGEPMSGYFTRLQNTLSQQKAQEPRQEARVTSCLELDGIYVHKRPIRAPNGSSPLAVCGSVLHHVVVYVTQGELLHTLDYGPANGADVTANILEEAPAKKVLTTGPLTEGLPRIAAAATATAAATPVSGSDSTAGTLPFPRVPTTQEELPYMYLGPAAYDVDHPLVRQLIAFAESRPYHALRNNCIHFADALVRVMTGGAVRGAPLLYDITCGSVPGVDNPMLLMIQLMLRMPWFVVVDGSPMTAAFHEHCRAISRPEKPQPQALPPTHPNDPLVAVAADSVREDQDNNVTAAAATGGPSASGDAAAASNAVAPTAEQAAGFISASGVAGVDESATQEMQDASGTGVGDERSLQQPQQQEEGTDAALGLRTEEERRQEQENNHAPCKVEVVKA